MEQTLGATFQATPSALSGDAGEGRSWPTALTQGLREILGIPNFQCGPMAHAYQKLGEFSGDDGQIGSAHVCTPVTNAQLVRSLRLEKNKIHHQLHTNNE